jgi:Zn-dependent protease
MLLSLSLLLLFMSLVIHELGHWALLTRYGVRTSEYWVGAGYRVLKIKKLCVGLFPIGAGIHPVESEFNALSPSQRVAVALAGPVASLVYAGGLALASHSLSTTAAGESLLLLAQLNLLIALFNLLPIPPLDGWVAFTSVSEHLGSPLNPKWAGIARRLGNGVIYGIGFFVLWGMAVKGLLAI